MPKIRNSAAFAALVSDLLGQGAVVRFRANGCSMGSTIRDGEAVYVAPAGTSGTPALGDILLGDILLTKGTAGFKAHRLVANDRNLYITKGDFVQTEDTPVSGNQVLGRVIAHEPHSFWLWIARRCGFLVRKIFA